MGLFWSKPSDNFDRRRKYFGHFNIEEIGEDEIRAWMNARLKQVAASTVRREITILKHIFSLAVSRPPDRLLLRNVFTQCSLRTQSHHSSITFGVILTHLGYTVAEASGQERFRKHTESKG
jgi:hypothetical protein